MVCIHDDTQLRYTDGVAGRYFFLSPWVLKKKNRVPMFHNVPKAPGEFASAHRCEVLSWQHFWTGHGGSFLSGVVFAGAPDWLGAVCSHVEVWNAKSWDSR